MQQGCKNSNSSKFVQIYIQRWKKIDLKMHKAQGTLRGGWQSWPKHADEEWSSCTYFPTKFSKTELLPALWLPTTAIWGRSSGLRSPRCENASCSLFTIWMRLCMPVFVEPDISFAVGCDWRSRSRGGTNMALRVMMDRTGLESTLHCLICSNWHIIRLNYC